MLAPNYQHHNWTASTYAFGNWRASTAIVLQMSFGSPAAVSSNHPPSQRTPAEDDSEDAADSVEATRTLLQLHFVVANTEQTGYSAQAQF